jgi:hypothetical protein
MPQHCTIKAYHGETNCMDLLLPGRPEKELSIVRALLHTFTYSHSKSPLLSKYFIYIQENRTMKLLRLFKERGEVTKRSDRRGEFNWGTLNTYVEISQLNPSVHLLCANKNVKNKYHYSSSNIKDKSLF